MATVTEAEALHLVRARGTEVWIAALRWSQTRAALLASNPNDNLCQTCEFDEACHDLLVALGDPCECQPGTCPAEGRS